MLIKQSESKVLPLDRNRLKVLGPALSHGTYPLHPVGHTT